MLSVKNLSKKFNGRYAVQHLTFDVHPGTVFGIIGPNGAGKTTTIRLILGLIKPTEGTISVDGIAILNEENARFARRKMGFLPENPAVYENLSAYKNLFYFGLLYGMEKEKLEERIQTILSLLGLEKRMHQKVKTFSKGMRQKIAIARAIVHEPSYLLLDEPTASLDPASAKTVREFVINLKNTKRTIILATHNLHEAEELCDKILVLNTVPVDIGKPSDLVKKVSSVRTVITVDALSQGAFREIKERFGDVNYYNNKLVFTVKKPDTQNPEIIRFLVEHNVRIRYVEKEVKNLEDVYIKLVSKNDEKTEN
ncbi:MAG: ABC transporter ATP-binding protein [Thermoplasmata archaeon]